MNARPAVLLAAVCACGGGRSTDLVSARYESAGERGRRVRQLVQQPFVFDLID